jgi:hypothetical protein
MKTVCSLVLSTALLAGCAGRHEAYCRYEGAARIGQTVYVSGPSIRPDEVLEDSRCPVDVTCVRAGTVRIRVLVIASGGTHPVELTLGQPVESDGGRLTLLTVQPQQRTTRTLAAEDYRFTFDFKAGE